MLHEWMSFSLVPCPVRHINVYFPLLRSPWRFPATPLSFVLVLLSTLALALHVRGLHWLTLFLCCSRKKRCLSPVVDICASQLVFLRFFYCSNLDQLTVRITRWSKMSFLHLRPSVEVGVTGDDDIQPLVKHLSQRVHLCVTSAIRLSGTRSASGCWSTIFAQAAATRRTTWSSIFFTV